MSYTVHLMLDIDAIRRQFPYLQSATLPIYLDSAATTQKPQAVIDAMRSAMERPVGNVHRGQHHETEVATDAYEAARKSVAEFIGAAHADEIIFTKNCTEAINLAAHAWARNNLKKGDVIALSILEHHSNIIQWLQLSKEQGVELLWIDIDDAGNVRMDQLEEYVQKGSVKFIAITGQSNVLGVRPPLEEIIRLAHTHGAKVLVDAAQLVAHAPVNVTDLDCDFLAFSGHKIYGPTGIGVLYAKRERMKEMIPFMGGGGMVHTVTTDTFTPADPPYCFEAGTPPIIQAIGLAAAINWQKQFSWADRIDHDEQLVKIAIEELEKIPGLRLLNSSPSSSCISFVIDSVHPHDLTDLLGQKHFALRAGHQCTQPLHKRLGITASTRMSFGMYTTEEEIRSCAQVITEIYKKFS
jgi:cysteine desulfurase / selenocysteine lyase